jgi:hypothetical protein
MPTDIPAVDDVIDDAPLPDHEVRPPWVDEVIHAVEAIPDAIKEAFPAPVPVKETEEIIPDVDNPPPHSDPDEDDEPGDETPESKPWTHKMPFSK